MNQNQFQYIQDDNIDIKALWTILSGRKSLIALTTLLFTVAAFLYTVLSKPIYEVRTVIEVAQIAGKNIQDIHDSQHKLEFVYIPSSQTEKEYPLIKEITIPKKTNSLLLITAQGYDNSSAVNKLQEVIKVFQGTQNKKINNYLSLQNSRITTVEQDLNITRHSINTITKKIMKYETKLYDIEKSNAALAAIYAIELGKMQTEVNTLRTSKSELTKRKNDLLYSITPMNIKETVQIGKIEQLDHPIKPRKLLIVIIAFITGLFMAIFIAFFLAFIKDPEL